MNSKAYRLVILSLYVAMALILSYIESLIPLPLPIPGAKIGLPNIITLVSLLTLGWPLTMLVVIARIFLSGFMFGGGFSIVYSLGGGLLSLLVMSLLLHFFKDKISIILISVFGAISHNLGQVIVAAIVVQTTSLLLYFLFLMLLAIPTGLFIGITARELMRLLGKTTIFAKLNLPQKK
ncbi:Gx transporter family protein [Acetobacterium sp.]|jgi:heptaprenyl diphosphate synthase|uniref:Gx transporter family protein n=1 Tax=Acetobacterium sp. TaxID=1872094 RepID=UPI000CAEF3DE|nr:Gx transporter family protein [Acetobacterium sp.]MDO9491870.1 Gx transporter family protein [Acetobacterium sp.]PKM71214.1 MAG: trans-hexaprenyltranstransferase [Firmicutes bacterium HGW-Firmicutes-17]